MLFDRRGQPQFGFFDLDSSGRKWQLNQSAPRAARRIFFNMEGLMILKRLQMPVLATLLCASPLFGETITSTWNADFTATSASGEINGVGISVTSTATAPLVGTSTDRFDNGGGGWQAGFPLPRDVAGLVATNVNGDDAQAFAFDSPLANGRLYIENFDASSSALISVTGDAPILSLLSGSNSISFVPSDEAIGTLTSSNPDSNGEGDAVLEFSGGVTGINVSFTEGVGANGIFYAFSVESVPEPSSGILALLATALVLPFRRRR